MPEQPIISLKSVSKVFGTGGNGQSVLNGISLEVGRGEHVAVVGRSGSGKSTLLNMITGIDLPSAGIVEVDGKDWNRMSESGRSAWRGRNIGIVFQFFQLIPTLTVRDNLLLAMEFVGKIPGRDRKGRIDLLLGKTGIPGHAGKYPGQLSGGEQQRAAIARALANDPPLVVADEPTGNLDSVNSDLIFDLFNSLTAEGKAVIVVTHERQLKPGFDRILEIRDGRLFSPAAGEGESR
jgi:putative ABC transport system ATP-binding protein